MLGGNNYRSIMTAIDSRGCKMTDDWNGRADVISINFVVTDTASALAYISLVISCSAQN